MNTSNRRILREIVQGDNSVELVIVHMRDGSNDFFSYEPDINECERQRIVAVCRSIIKTIEAMPRKIRSDKGSRRNCGSPGRPATCPADKR